MRHVTGQVAATGGGKKGKVVRVVKRKMKRKMGRELKRQHRAEAQKRRHDVVEEDDNNNNSNVQLPVNNKKRPRTADASSNINEAAEKKKTKDKKKKEEKKKKEKEEKKPKKDLGLPSFLVSAAGKDPEKMELAYLEKKLGIRSGGQGKRNKSRIAKELMEDGFGEDIGSFMDELDTRFQPPSENNSRTRDNDDDSEFDDESDGDGSEGYIEGFGSSDDEDFDMDEEVDDEEEGDDDDDDDDVSEFESIHDKNNKEDKKKKKKKEKKSTSQPQPAFLSSASNPEEMELAYLEKKLGLKGSRGKRNRSKIGKELADDGYGEDIFDFMDELDSKVFNKKRDFDDEESDSGEEEEDDEESGDEDDDDDNDEQQYNEEDEDGEEDEDADQDIDPALQGGKDTFVMSTVDMYGQNSVAPKPKTATTATTALDKKSISGANPAGERPRFHFQAAGTGGETARLRMRLNGLLNRLTETSIAPVMSDILKLYSDGSSRTVTETLTGLLLNMTADQSRIMDRLIVVLAALVTGLNISVQADVGAQIAEAVVLRFEKEHENEDLHVIADDAEVAASPGETLSKASANLALMLADLYTFQVIHHGLIFDLLFRLASKLRDLDILVLDALLGHIGYALRSHDPERFKDLFLAIAARAKATAKGGNTGAYANFLLNSVTGLKNNKQEWRTKHDARSDQNRRLMSWIRQLRTASASSTFALQVTWNELRDAETKGRWWVVGGVWAGRDTSASNGSADALASASAAAALMAGRNKDKGTVAGVLANANERVLKVARKRRMNTDVRKAVFCIMMGGYDYVEAFDRLLRLNLRARQEREIVHVLAVCCRDCKTYNPFFALLGNKLCEFRPSFKFTFQLHFWDAFKMLKDMQANNIRNLARLCADLVAHFSLSLAIFKVVEFTALSKRMVVFLDTFFKALLSCPDQSQRQAHETVTKVFRRIRGGKDSGIVRDGMLIFFKTQMKVNDATAASAVLSRRVELAASVLEEIGGGDMSDADDNDDEDEDGGAEGKQSKGNAWQEEYPESD